MVYFAKNARTGEIWESENFRVVYEAVRRSLREMMRGGLYYDFEMIIIYKGYSFVEPVWRICTCSCSVIDKSLRFGVNRCAWLGKRV